MRYVLVLLLVAVAVWRGWIEAGFRFVAGGITQGGVRTGPMLHDDVERAMWHEQLQSEIEATDMQEQAFCGQHRPNPTRTKNVTRIVFTYLESLPSEGDRFRILQFWKHSWERNGWHTVVLDAHDAQLHWDHAAYLRAVRRLPTINTRAYEDNCYLRWLAYEFALSRCGDYPDTVAVFSDYDVINLRWKAPQTLDAAACTLLFPHVPCLVSASFVGLAKLRKYLAVRAEFADLVAIRHTSDMILLQEDPSVCPVTSMPLGVGYADPHWRAAHLVHFSHHDTHQRDFRSQWAALQHEFKLDDE
jgi:hypothetical protein